jgi:hypothetical protein
MKRIEDERIVAEKRRINSSAFGICFLALWGILLFRQFVLQQQIAEYMDIFLLTVGISIYITVNNVFKGLYLTYRSKQARKKMVLIGALTGSVAFAIVQFTVMGYGFTGPEDILKLIIPVIIFFVIWIMGQSALLNISEIKANQETDDE